jgi:hypothetical protein
MDTPYLYLYVMIAVTAAFRLAHPASRWSGWFYGPDKSAAAEERYPGHPSETQGTL